MSDHGTPETMAAEPVPESIWQSIRQEALAGVEQEPTLASYLHAVILAHPTLAGALADLLAGKLADTTVGELAMHDLISEALDADEQIARQTCRDLQAVVDRDPACRGYAPTMLFFKGFQALQCYRVSHHFWTQGREMLALFLQSRIAQIFAVDIHPAATVGGGILLDHATGFVIGETAVVEDDVSMLHEVTLGGTGKERGDRHPKVRRGVLIGAGAKILGNIEIGMEARIGAGSVVLRPVPARCTAAGVPARIVRGLQSEHPAQTMNHLFDNGNGWVPYWEI